MNKQKELERIAFEIEQCIICQQGKIGKAVPGEGNPDAQIVFIGEAPGKQESLTGKPFIGRSGKLLRSAIQDIGLSEKDIYITSPVKYLPKRGTPSQKDIEHGKIHLDKQLAIIDPQIIVLLGSVACKGVLGQAIPVLEKHGTVIKKDSRTYFITVHPAAALRFPPLRKTFLEDFQKLKKLIT